MTPGLIKDREQELFEEVNVPYGEVRSVDKHGSIRTTRLYSCVGLILMDNERVALAHVPIMDEFAILRRNEEGMVVERKTFSQLMDELFTTSKLNLEDTKAIIVGGVKELSLHRVEEIRKILKDKGVNEANERTLYSKNTELDVSVKNGEVGIISRSGGISFGEGTY